MYIYTILLLLLQLLRYIYKHVFIYSSNYQFKILEKTYKQTVMYINIVDQYVLKPHES